jgi:histidinol-phosphate aminotransferase
MQGLLRSNISELEGYTPGEQPNEERFIKLNTNENPYPPSPRVLAALRKATNPSLRLYPDPVALDVRKLAAKVYDVAPEKIMAGNGSDELLSILMRCYIGQGDEVAYAVPTYTLYDTLISIQDGQKVLFPYPDDFTIPPGLYSQSSKITIICNPNAPSGTLEPLSEISRLAGSVAGILIVDEAYVDFAESEATAISLVSRFPNLIVLRSFSKSFSLAGLRIGLAFASEEIIQTMGKVKDSYNLCRLSLAAAHAALEDIDWMKRNVLRIQKTRKVLTRGLEKLGFEVQPSEANFVMARMGKSSLEWLQRGLKRKGILVRFFDLPSLQNMIRITVGKPREVQAMLRATEELLAERGREQPAAAGFRVRPSATSF